jgi:YD repeat-containing protein
VPYQITDINGWVSTTEYDRLGRTLSVTSPGLNTPGVKYFYPPVLNGSVAAPYSVKMELWDEVAGVYRPVWGIYDGMGRMLQTQTLDGERGELLVTETELNAQGLASRQSLPYYYPSNNGGTRVTGTPQYTETFYDSLGRPIQVSSPGNIVSYTQYDGLTTTSIDPNGNKVAHTTDGLGRMKYIQE